ncbi:MAG: N-acetyltransferase [Cloacibacillus sp.]
MEIELRLERTEDCAKAENLVREAFWNQYCPGCCEHYLLHVMRAAAGYVPELAIVAACGGEIIGNIVYMKAMILGDDGNKYEVLSMGPIAVLPEWQGKGIGAKMIEHTRRLAREMGFRAVLLCGDPDYYLRRGFVSAETLGVRTSENIYSPALHLCELYENALASAAGCYFEDEIYNVDEKAAAEFDALFPAKEAVAGTPAQKRFELLAALGRKADL